MSTERPRLAVRLAIAAFVVIGLSRVASGQSYEVLHAFTVPSAAPSSSLIRGSDGNFYGTTELGGGNGAGTVFKVDPAGNLTTIHTFSNSDGAYPVAGVVQGTDGSFYGTTVYGGASGMGVIFKVDSSGSFTLLHSFAGPEGVNPYGGLVQATDGNFYGTASLGGDLGGCGAGNQGCGSFFKMDSSGTVTKLHNFESADGVYPFASLIQGTDGKFYGTTRAGGTNNLGTVFRVDSSGTLTTLHTFNDGTDMDGANPSGALMQASDGKFYGTTQNGGMHRGGTVFRVDSLGNFASLHTFDDTDGALPDGGVVQAADGKLYGTTGGGGANQDGTVFRVDTTGNNFASLHSFAGTDGSGPVAGLIQVSGTFYGTTQGGGSNASFGTGGGTFFSMDTSGNVTTRFNFGAPSTGYEPEASVVQASDGNLYGTTFWGGPGNFGTIFQLTFAGTRTVVHDFTGDDGSQPWAKLVQASDGKLYGTGSRGGASQRGAAFSLTLAGGYSLLHSFNGTDGLGPRDSALVQRAADGMLYGLTEQGGTGYGNAFKMDTSGNVTSLHSFIITEGVYPSDGLLLASDGNVYGTTATGGTGANPQGTVFKMTPSGTVTTLHQFNHVQGVDDDGMWPVGGLIQATDEKFYGTTRAGGANTAGNVFRIDSAGNYATIHSFAGRDGSEPYGNLLQGSDGKLYGTTRRGGPNDAGTIFSIDTTGANFTTMHALTGEDGSGPVGTLIQASDGKLYGTTAAGGPGKSGVVFRVTLSSCTPPPPPVASSNSPICAGQTLALSASTIAGATYSWSGPNGFTSTQQNPTIPNATTSASGTYTVTATVGGCSSVPAMTTATIKPLPSSTVSAPASVCPNSTGNVASVPDAGPGASYSWSITNGTITAGSGTRTITFSAGATGSVSLGVTITSANGCAASASAVIPMSTTCHSFFYTVTPCRVIDTRNPTGPYGGPALAANADRSFVLIGQCAIPASAKAVSINVTITQPTALGDLRLYPGGASLPLVSAINYRVHQTRANNAIITLGAAGDIAVHCDQASGTVQFLLDLNGYFQ